MIRRLLGVGVASALLCDCSPPRSVAQASCDRFAAALSAANSLRSAGRLGRARRAYDALDARCDRGGELRTAKDAVARELGAEGQDPMDLVHRAELATREGHGVQAQVLYEKAVESLRALELEPRIDFASPSAPPMHVAVDGDWSAVRFGDEVRVFEGSVPRFDFPIARSLDYRLDANARTLSADDGTGWSLSSGRPLARAKPLKPIPRSAWRSVAYFVKRPMPTAGYDDVVAARRLATGKVMELVATVIAKSATKASPEVTEATVQLSASELDDAGARVTAVDLMQLKCEIDGSSHSPERACAAIDAVQVSANGGTILIAAREATTAERTFFVFDAKTGRRRITMTTGEAPSSLRLSTDGATLFAQSHSEGTRSRLYELHDTELVKRWEREDVPSANIDAALNAAGSLSLLSNGVVSVLDARDGAATTATTSRSVALGVALVAAQAPWLVVALGNEEVRALNGHESRMLSNKVVPTSLRFARNRPWLIGAFGATVDVFDASGTGKVTVVRDMRMWDSALSPDAHRLVAAGTDAMLPVWEIPSKASSAPFESPTSSQAHARVDWSHDGKLVAASDDAGTLVFDARTRSLVRTIPNESTQRVLFAHDDSIVGLGLHELWRSAPLVGGPVFRVALEAEATDMVVLHDDVFVSLPGVVEWRSLTDGSLRGRFEVDAKLPHLGASDSRVYVTGPKALVIIARGAFGFSRVGELQFGTNETILNLRGASEIIGRSSDAACAVGTWRLPLAACDGISVDPGPGDLFSRVF